MHDDTIAYIWSTEIFQLAFQSGPLNPLLDILLGVSAQHLKLVKPDDIFLSSAASVYFDRGLQRCNEMLSHIDKNSCLLFTSSILIALQSLLLRQELARREPYNVPISWFRALRGVNVIASAGRPWIVDSKLRALLLDAQPQAQMDHVEVDATFTELLVGVAGNSEPDHVAVYESAVKYLHWIYVLGQGGEEIYSLRRKLLAFPSRVSSSFMSLLETSDPRALVITAHFFGLIQMVDDIWWLQGMAHREITGLLTIVPENWMWAMEWPVKQIQHSRSLT
jgi:hypothetical protein